MIPIVRSSSLESKVPLGERDAQGERTSEDEPLVEHGLAKKERVEHFHLNTVLLK